jgi:hypothetical protein
MATGQRAAWRAADITNITIPGGSGPVYAVSPNGSSSPDLRWECSGATIIVHVNFITYSSSSGGGSGHMVRILIDGVEAAAKPFLHDSSTPDDHNFLFVLETVTAGNHTIGIAFYTPASEDYIVAREEASGRPNVLVYEDMAP